MLFSVNLGDVESGGTFLMAIEGSTMHPQVLTPVAPSASQLADLVFVDADESSRCVSSLREQFHVTHVTTVDAAVRAVERVAPSMLVTELALADGSGTEVCRAAKRLHIPATVLVTTSDVAQVPDAIAAGCDAVLLKPFAPNLLFARLGRLCRTRSVHLRYKAAQHRAKSDHLLERADLLMAGTNQHWPHTHCPYCAHQGVTSFEFTSYRRAWYACLDCKRVWLAKRQE
jgi:DNA-binding response OmpR family regulator